MLFYFGDKKIDFFDIVARSLICIDRKMDSLPIELLQIICNKMVISYVLSLRQTSSKYKSMIASMTELSHVIYLWIDKQINHIKNISNFKKFHILGSVMSSNEYILNILGCTELKIQYANSIELPIILDHKCIYALRKCTRLAIYSSDFADIYRAPFAMVTCQTIILYQCSGLNDSHLNYLNNRHTLVFDSCDGIFGSGIKYLVNCHSITFKKCKLRTTKYIKKLAGCKEVNFIECGDLIKDEDIIALGSCNVIRFTHCVQITDACAHYFNTCNVICFDGCIQLTKNVVDILKDCPDLSICHCGGNFDIYQTFDRFGNGCIAKCKYIESQHKK